MINLDYIYFTYKNIDFDVKIKANNLSKYV